MITPELTRWALAVPLPKSRQIGADRVGRVLVALVQYADRSLVAYPSPDTLAGDLSGLAARDVRNALAVLEAAGLIEPTTPDRRRGSTVRWRIRADEVAGIPATSTVQQARPERGDPRYQNAGENAGENAGRYAGIPATNQNQNQNHPPTPRENVETVELTSTTRAGKEEISPRTADALRAAGVPEIQHAAVYAAAAADPTTTHSAGARITAAPEYVRQLWTQHQARQQAAREAHRLAQPECPEHGQGSRVGSCNPCAIDHKLGDHHDDPRDHCPACTTPTTTRALRLPELATA